MPTLAEQIAEAKSALRKIRDEKLEKEQTYQKSLEQELDTVSHRFSQYLRDLPYSVKNSVSSRIFTVNIEEYALKVQIKEDTDKCRSIPASVKVVVGTEEEDFDVPTESFEEAFFHIVESLGVITIE